MIDSETKKRIWGDEKFYLFLSHKSEDKIQVAQLKEELKKYKISSFVAHEDIEPAQKWQDEIENALFSMDALVAILTNDFKNSDWTGQEIGVALGRKKPIIAVRMGTDPYGFISKYQALSMNWDDIPLLAQEIVKILLQNKKMVDAYIELMKECKSFDQANKLAEFLPSISSITKKQANKILKIYSSNDQISGSYGFTGYDEKGFDGIVHHLNRASPKTFKFDEDWNIKET